MEAVQVSEGNRNDTVRTGADRESEGLEFPADSSRTKQEFRDETNINNVVAQHAVTGQFTHVSSVMPEYGDFSNVMDYQEARNQILQAELAFAQLPAAVRKRMGNDPATFIDFLEDPNNQEEAVKLGLAEAPPRAAEPPGPQVGDPRLPSSPKNPTEPPDLPIVGGE